MLFNTYVYAVFLMIVYLLYQALPLRGRQLMLLLASYTFYCWEQPFYGCLLVISTVLDYACGRVMERSAHPGRRRAMLLISVLGNLSLLGFFKYGDFFGSNIAGMGRLLGFDTSWTYMHLILPAGISFYTFQTMSYTIQLYRRRIQACHDPLAFALYVSFFPQLVAGPIERASHLLPQLQVYHRFDWSDLSAGLTRIVFGLFRKVVLADRFAIYVDRVFANPEHFPTFSVWLGLLAFWGQIYFDFAGYADIAIGSARLFGIRLTENFRRPLLSRSIADFWTRWHITLTSWLRDYVFQPLGGVRKGPVRALLNTALVLILCGLWHGAAWHFVLWGAYEALLMVAYLVWKVLSKRLFNTRKLKDSLPWLIVSISILLVCHSIATVFFRAPTMHDVGRMFVALLGRHEGAGLSIEWYTWVYTVVMLVWLVIEFLQEYRGLNDRIRRLHPWLRAGGMALLVVIIILAATNVNTPYMYFQF